MESVNRYLKAVKSFLPRQQQDDIIKELSDNILSQMEDRQRELGHHLSEAEQQAILHQLGEPLLVAARYRQEEHSLALGRRWIGPLLFPLYARVLRFNMGSTAVVCVIIAVVLGKPLLAALPTILAHLFVQLSIVTLIFATAETSLSRCPQR